jgi:hypothetical protein
MCVYRLLSLSGIAALFFTVRAILGGIDSRASFIDSRQNLNYGLLLLFIGTCPWVSSLAWHTELVFQGHGQPLVGYEAAIPVCGFSLMGLFLISESLRLTKMRIAVLRKVESWLSLKVILRSSAYALAVSAAVLLILLPNIRQDCGRELFRQLSRTHAPALHGDLRSCSR